MSQLLRRAANVDHVQGIASQPQPPLPHWKLLMSRLHSLSLPLQFAAAVAAVLLFRAWGPGQSAPESGVAAFLFLRRMPMKVSPWE